jgi:hypothetical protein
MSPVVVGSWEPEYTDLKAAAEVGEAQFLGERFVPEGVLAAFDIGHKAGYRRNPSIQIGREFFSSAVRDYQDWKEKWWREAIQNAVDAGATRIEMREVVDANGQREIECIDNGKGMSLDTLINKFLVLGATGKTAEVSVVGGFGKAKELLILPWLSWEIHSGTVGVLGEGAEYEVMTLDKPQPGTMIRVVMPKDQCTNLLVGASYVKKCHIPGVQFVLEGISYQRYSSYGEGEEEIPGRVGVRKRWEIKADLATGKLVHEVEGKASVYYDEKEHLDGAAILIRARGLYMFYKWPPADLQGTVIVEVTGKSTELLTANRDGFRDDDLRRDIERYFNKLASDVRSAIREKKKLVRKSWKGSGKFTAARPEELRALLMAQLRGLATPDPDKPLVLAPYQTRGLMEAYISSLPSPATAEAVEESARKEGAGINLTLSPEVLEAFLRLAFTGPVHVENAVKQMVWEPDFFLMNNVDDFDIHKDFYPETMSKKIKKLTKFWAELCRFILIQLNNGDRWGVGFVFEDDERGKFVRDDDGEQWILLNPYKETTGSGYGMKIKMPGAIYDLSNDRDVAMLYAIAVHEATHMADGVEHHNEVFSSAFTVNVAKTSGMEKHIRQILKAVKKEK